VEIKKAREEMLLVSNATLHHLNNESINKISHRIQRNFLSKTKITILQQSKTTLHHITQLFLYHLCENTQTQNAVIIFPAGLLSIFTVYTAS